MEGVELDAFGERKESNSNAVGGDKYLKENKQFHELFITSPPSEYVVEYFSCAKESRVQFGKMYITNMNTIYFHSKVPFYGEVKEKIMIESIESLETADANSTIADPFALTITTKDKKTHKFLSLAFRDQCYELLHSKWTAYKEHCVYAVPLAVLCKTDGTEIPKIVVQLVDFISSNCITMEGIFRISASKSELELFQKQIDAGQTVDLSSCNDRHVPPALLKKFFRDLPDPLFTAELYACFMTLPSTRQLGGEEHMFNTLKSLIKQLPTAHRTVAKYLIDFLFTVSQHESSNKMSKKNLSIVWGPLLFRNSEDIVDLNTLQETGFVNELFEIILSKREALFS